MVYPTHDSSIYPICRNIRLNNHVLYYTRTILYPERFGPACADAGMSPSRWLGDIFKRFEYIYLQPTILERIISHGALFAVLILLYSCNGQPQSNNKSVPNYKDIPSLVNILDDVSEGIVYFSYDNGFNWENESSGLPSTVHIGLGGIAASENNLALLSKDSGLYLFDDQKKRWLHVPTDPQLMKSNPGALLFFKHHLYAATQHGGIFQSMDEGKTWTNLNDGLDNLGIRKFADIENTLYAATNSGLYSYDELRKRWKLEYGSSTLQVNGLTTLDGSIYIATNQGAFVTPIGKKEWKKIYSKGTLHNIGSGDKTLYAMVYDELFSTSDKGKSWQSIQKGLPKGLYTFNVIQYKEDIFAGQWDGVYRKSQEGVEWQYSGDGLPEKMAVTNLIEFKGILVAAGSERRLKPGKTIKK